MYPASNLKADGRITAYATYTGDIVLTWSPAMRGKGAGIGDPDSVIDASPTWEGYFKIKVYAHDTIIPSGNLVRTTEDIDATTWTYTAAMNLSDNVTLPDYVTFVLTNYRISIAGIEYESLSVAITVKKE